MVSLTEVTNMQVEEIGQVHKGKLDIYNINKIGERTAGHACRAISN